MNVSVVERLVEGLRVVVKAAITNEFEPMEFEHAVIWWEPYDDCGSKGVTAVRQAKDFRFISRMLHADPSMEALRTL